MNAHFIVLGAYSAAIIGFGLVMGRAVRRSSDFFVAGRALGPGLLFATFMAANIGAGTTVGAASLGYRFGLSAWWWVGSAAIGTLLLAFWVGPKIHEIATRHGFYTAGDFLEFRYGPTVRGIVAAVLWLGTLLILAGQFVALAVLLDVVLGVPKAVGCLIGGLVTTTYFTAGGLRGAVWINLVQLVVLLGGFVLIVPMALSGVGGWDGLSVAGTEIGGRYLNFWDGGGSGWTLVALLVPPFIVSPGLLQKVYAARNPAAVRWGLGATGLALLIFAFGPALLGMVARVHHPGLANPDHALPALLVSNLPIVIGALGLGALFVADISSADTILFMLATSLSQDLYRRFINPDASDARLLRVARAAAFGGGAAAVGLAIAAESIVQTLQAFYAIVGVSLFVPVVVGLYTGRAGAPEALASVGGGIALTLGIHLATGGAGYGPFSPAMFGYAASTFGFAAVAIVRMTRPTAVQAG